MRSGAVALSAQLPIQAETHPAKKVKPYLFGLLPENRQGERAALTLGLEPSLLVGRVTTLAQGFPKAFEKAVLELTDSVPGADQICERAVPALIRHTHQVLDRL